MYEKGSDRIKWQSLFLNLSLHSQPSDRSRRSIQPNKYFNIRLGLGVIGKRLFLERAAFFLLL
jgi:hypothetical protein